MTTGKNLGVDLGTSGGEWLFRQNDIVLGPLPAHLLIEKLYAGEVDGRTEVTRMGQNSYQRISEIDFFKLHLAKAEAKLRVDATARAEQARTTRALTTKMSVGLVVSLALLVGAGFGANYLAVHKPWKNADELAFADISIDPPEIKSAASRIDDEGLLEYPTGSPNRPGGGRRADRGRGADHGTGAKPGPVPEEPDGLMTEQFDRAAINQVVERNKIKLHPCLAAEAARKPGLVATIPIEFTVGNDGKVGKIWVDNPDFKDGSLPECLAREFKSWKFKPYEGEQANVGLRFNIGKR